MVQIKDNAQIAEKWSRVTQARTQDYALGIQSPRRDWRDATLAAASAYAAGIQASLANKSYDKGVSKAGTAKWQANALSKGPSRFAQGVAGGQSSYEEGFAPFRQVIASLTLPPRGPAGDPKNIDRVRVIADALHKRKLAG